MERLIVDAEGKVTLPSEFVHQRGLRPGDELALVEAAAGWLVYQGGPGGVDVETRDWWNGLNEAARHEAREEARQYEALSKAERDALWAEEPVSIEEDAEGDEIELSARECAA